MTKSPRLSFQQVTQRIAGISTPVFSVNWNPPEDKGDIVRRLVSFLEDRSALYADFHMEYGPWVEESALEMPAEIRDALKTCPEDDRLTRPLRAMRAACRAFLDEMGPPHNSRRAFYPRDAIMWQAPGGLGGVFGLRLARLCTAVGADLGQDLGAISPARDPDSEPP